MKNVKLQSLRRYFENLSMKDSETMNTFMTQVISIVNWLRHYGEGILNKRVIEKCLHSFPNKFELVVVSVEEFKYTSQIQIDELISSLISHESSMNRHDNSALENIFKTQLQFTKWRHKRSYSNIRRGNILHDHRCRRDNLNMRRNISNTFLI